MLDLLLQDSEKCRSTAIYRLKNNLASLKDQDEIINYSDSFYAFWFALYIPGADIDRCQEAACKSPEDAYEFAKHIHGANIEKCQEICLKDPYWAYLFARDIPGADIKKCQEVACKDTYYAYGFAKLVKGGKFGKM